MGRHAFLIMAHHRVDLLELLLSALDDGRNDIYLHVDAKSTIDATTFSLKYSKLYLVDRIDVRWGGYSQIACELKLYDAAVENGPYDYYHLLTGSTYPLMSNNRLHRFFEENAGWEFIGFDNADDYSDRVRFTHLFNELGKEHGLVGHGLVGLRHLYVLLQKMLGRDRLKGLCGDDGTGFCVKKGLAYTSVTEDFVRYVLDRRDFIRDIFSESLCCDEVFLQTLAFNSRFRERVFDCSDEFEGSKRANAWECHESGTSDVNLNMEDLAYLLQSGHCFALKFEGSDGVALIGAIEEQRRADLV